MKQFQYKVTVIVPVYNVSEYLEHCLDSLLAQTMPREQMEILLINDGSTDNSLDICKRYAEQHDVFKVFSKENEGLSATRNFGISRAKGKYMMYIDSDDAFTPETVEAVTTFFDSHYDETDLVTYLDQPYRFDEKMKVHYRYQYMTHDGIYDLEQYPYISQTRVNICVKNMDDNPLFDTTPGFRLEDQEYCSKVLKDKQKIGFCSRGEYQYNRSNEGSIVSNYFYAYYIFESSMAYFERLFGEFEGKVPKYYQAMYL
ncbi:MAG: glycosyltransferase, partial [Lachnospiraceae bacterium]|nr:glycosyltransferase [Lachnospiraceae bacterium]